MPNTFTAARQRMVETQLVRRGILDPRVLDAMRAVPRHRFVAETQAAEAYADYPLPIGHDQTISQPYIVAYMIEQLRLTPTSRVFEVGAGCGYQAAVLARVAGEIYAAEIVDSLTRRARRTLDELGVTNVTVATRDGSEGWPEYAPFDGIIVAAAASAVPPALVDQLADGGRLIIPVGDGEFQTLRLIEKHGSDVTETELIGVRFVRMKLTER